MGLTSWRALLDVLRQEADKEGNRSFLGDVEQLGGLCSRMDGKAFMPLTARELSPGIGRRVQQLADLVDDVVVELVRERGASTEGLTTGGSQSAYGRYFKYADVGCFFFYSPDLWARFGEPVWLQVNEIVDNKWQGSRRITDALERLYAATPGRVMEHNGRTMIAIGVPTGVERDEVIAEIIDQIGSIVGYAAKSD